MSSERRFVGVALALALSSPSAHGAKDKNSPRVDYLQRQLKQQRQKVENLKNENLILRQLVGEKAKKKGVKDRGAGKAEKKVVTNKFLFDHKRSRLIKEFSKLQEKEVYARVIEGFRARDGASLEAALFTLEKKFPTSIYVDNALYLDAILAMQKKAYSSAIYKLENVIKRYPKGNKRVSALFAKGIIYKKLNLIFQSQHVLTQVVKEYPGSSESQRAVSELKLLGKYNNSAATAF